MCRSEENRSGVEWSGRRIGCGSLRKGEVKISCMDGWSKRERKKVGERDNKILRRRRVWE